MRNELIRQAQILSTQKFYAENAPPSEYACLKYMEKAAALMRTAAF